MAKGCPHRHTAPCAATASAAASAVATSAPRDHTLVPRKWKDSTVALRLRETGGGGDCMFHALAAGITAWCRQQVSMKLVRSELARSITCANAASFLERVRADHREHVPQHALDLNKVPFPPSRARIALRNKLRNLVLLDGVYFQGTDVCAQQLVECSEFFQRGAGVGVVMFSSHGPSYTRVEPFPTGHGVEGLRGTYILLYSDANSHWTLANVLLPGGVRKCFVTASELRLMIAML